MTACAYVATPSLVKTTINTNPIADVTDPWNTGPDDPAWLLVRVMGSTDTTEVDSAFSLEVTC